MKSKADREAEEFMTMKCDNLQKKHHGHIQSSKQIGEEQAEHKQPNRN